MKPFPDEPVDRQNADEVGAKLTLKEQLSSIGEEMLASAKRLATDPEHRARIQKLLV